MTKAHVMADVSRVARLLSPYRSNRHWETGVRVGEKATRTVLGALEQQGLLALWGQPIKYGKQVWINYSDQLAPDEGMVQEIGGSFPALATKPLGGFWTLTAATDEEVDVVLEFFLEHTRAASVWRAGEYVGPEPCVFEIGSSSDWVELCEEFPMDTTDWYGPRLNRWGVWWKPPFITPNWQEVAEAYTGVHLQWSGLIDTMARQIQLNPGSTMLVGWESESTVWSRWCFDEWKPVRFDRTVQ